MTENIDIIDGKTLLESGKEVKMVEVHEFPISERYCYFGALGTINKGQIRVGGCWFNFDERWKVKILN